MAGTTGSDSQKQFLTLIRNFATEKSQGERRIVGLKKQIEEIRSELEAANAELEDAKRAKEITEQELKGYEFELALSDTSIQSLKSRISLIQDEILTVGSDLGALKNEEGALRDEFISQMFDLNAKIRKFQETFTYNFQECSFRTEAEGQNLEGKELNEVASIALEDMIANVLSQTTASEEELESEQNIQKQVVNKSFEWLEHAHFLKAYPSVNTNFVLKDKPKVVDDLALLQSQRELIDSERKVSLVEIIMKTSQALQDLTSQTSELEQMCTSTVEGLQRRCICPNCHLDNVEVLGDILQPN